MNNLYQRAAKIGTNFETRSTFRSCKGIERRRHVVKLTVVEIGIDVGGLGDRCVTHRLLLRAGRLTKVRNVIDIHTAVCLLGR